MFRRAERLWKTKWSVWRWWSVERINWRTTSRPNPNRSNRWLRRYWWERRIRLAKIKPLTRLLNRLTCNPHTHRSLFTSVFAQSSLCVCLLRFQQISTWQKHTHTHTNRMSHLLPHTHTSAPLGEEHTHLHAVPSSSAQLLKASSLLHFTWWWDFTAGNCLDVPVTWQWSVCVCVCVRV